jgi:UPF0271 protein
MSTGMTRTIDLNCDMGESFGAYSLGADALVMSSISSANVACGFHAGDPAVMRRTVRMARDAGVAIGAHPGFPDLVGFGRREMRASPQEVEDMVLYQIGALDAVARSEGVRLNHVKAHGALYNMAARDRSLADAIARAVRSFDEALILFVLPASELQRAGEAAGLRVAPEGFADRSYEPDGSLTPRSLPGAVIHDVDAVVARAIDMTLHGSVVARNGIRIAVPAATICTHGDTPGADELTRRIRAGLTAAGIVVTPPEQARR